MARFRIVGLVALATVTAVDAAAQLAAGCEEASRRETVFRDCAECPEMVVVPAGSFTMGSPSSEEGRRNEEGSRHRVRISEPFAVGKYVVTFAEWHACASDGGCSSSGRRGGSGRGDLLPVTWVSWDDAQSYAGWLNRKTGKEYRLLSESEWEYAARGGPNAPYAMELRRKREVQVRADLIERLKKQVERGRPPARFAEELLMRVMRECAGTAGSSLRTVSRDLIWEWVEDCWNGSYAGAPADGSAWESGNCSLRVLRGGFWGNVSGDRGWAGTGTPSNVLGFRVARTLTP